MCPVVCTGMLQCLIRGVGVGGVEYGILSEHSMECTVPCSCQGLYF